MDSSKVLRKKNFLKIVVVRDSSVGKTTLLEKYLSGNDLTNVKPTIGADFKTKQIDLEGGKQVALQVWDTAGQEKYQSLGAAFYRGSDCCALVFDLTSQESFEQLAFWKKGFTEYVDTSRQAKFPFVVLGNKVDLESERKVSKEVAEEWCK